MDAKNVEAIMVCAFIDLRVFCHHKNFAVGSIECLSFFQRDDGWIQRGVVGALRALLLPDVRNCGWGGIYRPVYSLNDHAQSVHILERQQVTGRSDYLAIALIFQSAR